MIFSSYVFLLAFLPIVLIGYFILSQLKNRIYQRLFLIAASLFFCGYVNLYSLFLMLGSIIVNYIVSVFVQKSADDNKRGGKIILIVGIIFNVALLGYFKYYNFFIDTINSVFATDVSFKNLILPLGISFFTFQQLLFILSVYRKKNRVDSFLDYTLFVSFFPQLVSGPIVLYDEMMPQLTGSKCRRFITGNFSAGLYIFAIGLFKKAVIADTIAVFVNNGMNISSPGLITAWATALSYTMQLYFDFSGYSDMAVGIGKMFNVDLPYNFNSPYKSKSISEFWRRWHITLGRALTSLVYIPLGGNRKGVVRTCINLFLVFMVSGLWHGTGWTFVLWGAFNGLFVVLERIFKNILEKFPAVIRTVVTFFIVNFLWVLFRAESFAQAARIYLGMFGRGGIKLSQLQTVAFDGIVNYPAIVDYFGVLGFVALLLVWVFALKNSNAKYEGFTFTKKSAVFTALLIFVSVLCLSRQSVFLYFNF